MPCPNPERPPHTVPLVRQTWLAKKKGRYIALRPIVDRGALTVAWEVVEAATEGDAGLRPGGLLQARRRPPVWPAAPPSTRSTSRPRAWPGGWAIMPLAAVLVKPSGRGRDYLAAGTYPEPDAEGVPRRTRRARRAAAGRACPHGQWTPGSRVAPYGLTRFRDLFTPRQLATLCAFAQGVRETHAEMVESGMDARTSTRGGDVPGARIVDRPWPIATRTLCRWHRPDEKMLNTYARQALPMVVGLRRERSIQ